MRPVVVWDMGGIMYRYFTEMIVDVGRANGWPVDEMPLGPTHPVPDPAYWAMDRGDITEPQYLEAVTETLAFHGIDFNGPRDLDWSDEFRAETWEAIERLAGAGFRQGLLTNDASKWLGDRWWETWEPARWFDAVIDVNMIGVRKPAPEPYLAAAKALGVVPESCLFIDDMHCNGAGAEAVGMKSFWFDITRPAESISELYQRLDAIRS